MPSARSLSRARDALSAMDSPDLKLTREGSAATREAILAEVIDAEFNSALTAAAKVVTAGGELTKNGRAALAERISALAR